MAMESTRDGFGEGIVKIGRSYPQVVVLSADLTSSTRAGWFKERYPNRFFCFGVAEQDMMCAAAGFALSGKIPFACTFGVFAAGRAWDQIRISICSMNLNVKIIGTHGGVSVGADGLTHQALEEISLMRCLPNMTIIVPSDVIEARKATMQAVKYPGPVYIRLGRNPVPVVTSKDAKFKIGKANLLKKGKDITIIACGLMVYEALRAHDSLKTKGINAEVINLHTIKPIDKNTIIRSARKTGAVVTVEEHTINGGLGSAVAEVLSENHPVLIKRIGVQDRFGVSGPSTELLEKFGLTYDNIVGTSIDLLKKKDTLT